LGSAQMLLLVRKMSLKVSQLPVGLLVNFHRGKLEWKRLQNNQECIIDADMVKEPVSF